MTIEKRGLKVKSQFDIIDNVEILILDAKTLNLIDRFEDGNLFVTDGRNLVRDFLNNNLGSPVGVTHLAVGTGTTGAVASDSTLETEQFRNSLTKRTPSSGSIILSYYLASTQANGNDLTEAGLFNHVSAGDMFARVTHDAIVKTTSIAVMYNWTLNIGAS